ncbi:hypothetical protein B0J12DRAFT_298103 [Macrophomina phaseolina]|uniref:Uncharacterized protein n=1 Tax=Macrophomina phaseolina TaxID=35725 RepID=A0ABQ8GPK4_9PEZI|nr:hypothetical protein B0J12DRAFT_298103 [Macrophomina phaseolina]
MRLRGQWGDKRGQDQCRRHRYIRLRRSQARDRGLGGGKKRKERGDMGSAGWGGWHRGIPWDRLHKCRPRYRAQDITVEFPSSIASSCSRPLLGGRMLISLEEGGPSSGQGLIRRAIGGPSFKLRQSSNLSLVSLRRVRKRSVICLAHWPAEHPRDPAALTVLYRRVWPPSQRCRSTAPHGQDTARETQRRWIHPALLRDPQPRKPSMPLISAASLARADCNHRRLPQLLRRAALPPDDALPKRNTYPRSLVTRARPSETISTPPLVPSSRLRTPARRFLWRATALP